MRKDQIIRATFTIFDGDGNRVTGRAGTVSTNLQRNNTATTETVTVAESSDVSGDYQASFTPTNTGAYRLDVADATYNSQGWTRTWDVLEYDSDSLGTIVAAILVDTGTSGVVIATSTQQSIADELLKRGASNVEDDADAHSLTAMILAALESSITDSTWTIRKTGGTTFTTKSVTTNALSDPITGVT